jgi:hypothetical protein
MVDHILIIKANQGKIVLGPPTENENDEYEIEANSE